MGYYWVAMGVRVHQVDRRLDIGYSTRMRGVMEEGYSKIDNSLGGK